MVILSISERCATKITPLVVYALQQDQIHYEKRCLLLQTLAARRLVHVNNPAAGVCKENTERMSPRGGFKTQST